MERRHRDDPDAVIAELAHHQHEALAVGDPERAYDCARRAAERATRLLAHEQAALHWGQAVAALEHCESVDPQRRLDALLALGEAHRLAGDRPRRRAAFGAAIGFCDLSEWSPIDPEAREATEAALAELPPEATAERVRLLTRVAYLAARGETEKAVPVARQAVEEARAAGDPSALQDALYTLLFLLAGPDHLGERDRLAREAETVARASGTTDPTVIALLDLACDRIAECDPEGARHWRKAAGEVAGHDPHLGRVWHLRVHDAGIALLEGRFEDAERDIEELARVGQRIEHPYARGVERALRAFLARDRGDDEEVLRIFDPTRPIRIGPVQFVQAVVGRALAACGRPAEAAAVSEDLMAGGVEGIPRNIRWAATVAETALLAAELGDQARARALLPLIEPFAARYAVLPLATYSGPFARCLARLEETLGRLDRADARWEEAAEIATLLGARPMQARVQVEHGRCLARRGERRRARERLGEGARLAEALAMTRLAREAHEALAEA
ncbi:MAG TPA: hypothetical protein VIN04_00065 [Myxococcota bacterium]